MKNITIIAKTSIESATEIQNAINLGFDTSFDHIVKDNVEVKNNLFTYVSTAEDEEIVETISISSETLVKLIMVFGNLYCTVKPLLTAVQSIFKGVGEQFNSVIGETVATVNGKKRERQVTCGRCTELHTKDGTKIRTRIKVTASSKEAALAAVDAEFDKLGYHTN